MGGKHTTFSRLAFDKLGVFYASIPLSFTHGAGFGPICILSSRERVMELLTLALLTESARVYTRISQN